jgi:hypothetical protein
MMPFFSLRGNKCFPFSSTYVQAVSKIPASFLNQRDVVCYATLDSRDVPISGTQLKVSALNIPVQNLQEIVKLKTFVEQVESKPAKYGAGLLGYVGTTNPEGTVFLGSNLKTDSHIVRFLNDDGLKLFEDLRNANVFSENLISTIEGQLKMPPPPGVNQLSQMTDLIEKTRDNQQKKRKSLIIKNQALEIGSKSSGGLVVIKPVAKANQAVVALEVLFCFKLKYAKDFGYTLQTNPTINIKDVIAFTIIDSLKFVTSSELLLYLTNTLQKNFSVSQVIGSKADRKTLSKSGLYVVRSLTGILNKLKEPATSIETEAILLEWFKTQLPTVPAGAKDQVQILKKFEEILSGAALPALKTFTEPPASTKGSKKAT